MTMKSVLPRCVDFVSLIVLSTDFQRVLVAPTIYMGETAPNFRFPGVETKYSSISQWMRQILQTKILPLESVNDPLAVKTFLRYLQPLGVMRWCENTDFLFSVNNHQKLFVPCVLREGVDEKPYLRTCEASHPLRQDVTLLPLEWVSLHKMVTRDQSYRIPAAHQYAAATLRDVLRQRGVYV